MNKGNLYQYQERTPQERQECARNAGVASGKARRERKALREMMEAALSMEEQNEGYRSMMKKAGYDDEICQQAVITQGLIQRAKTGDVQAYNAIRDIVGEKPVDESNCNVNGGFSGELKITHVMKSESDAVFPSSESEVDVD